MNYSPFLCPFIKVFANKKIFEIILNNNSIELINE